MGTQEWPKPALPWCKGARGGLTLDPIAAVRPTCASCRGQAWIPGAEEADISRYTAGHCVYRLLRAYSEAHALWFTFM